MKVLCRFSILPIFLLAIFSVPAVRAETDPAIQRKAEACLKSFGKGLHQSLYRDCMSEKFKSSVDEETFVLQSATMLQQLGGPPADRRLIDSGEIRQLPTPGGPRMGTFPAFKFKARYPVGAVYEDLVFEKEKDGEWRMAGLWFNPAPQ